MSMKLQGSSPALSTLLIEGLIFSVMSSQLSSLQSQPNNVISGKRKRDWARDLERELVYDGQAITSFTSFASIQS